MDFEKIDSSEIRELISNTHKATLERMTRLYPNMKGKVHLVDGCELTSPQAKNKRVKEAINAHYNRFNPLRLMLHFGQHDFDLLHFKSKIPNEYLCSGFRTGITEKAYIIYTPSIDSVISDASRIGWLRNNTEAPSPKAKTYSGLLNLTTSAEYSLMHEFGHALFGHQKYKLSHHEHEIAADVFSVIHHIKKHGPDTILLPELVDQRHVHFVLGDILHHTSHALCDIMSRNSQTPLCNLSEQEIVNVSIQVAKKYGQKRSELKSIAKPFHNLRKQNMLAYPNESLTELHKIFNNESSPHVKKQAVSLIEVIKRRSAQARTPSP